MAFSSVKACPATGKAEGQCPFQDIVKATAGVVAPKVPEIVNDFYPRMFKNNPEVKAIFNPANQFAEPPLQRMALGNAVCAYASNIDNLDVLKDAVELIAHKHCALGVTPQQYPVVHDNLLASVAHVLGDAVTPEVGRGWSEAVNSLADILIKAEEGLYQEAEKRQGGWRGVKDFKVSSVRKPTAETAEVTFEAAEGPRTAIDFTPGQYITVILKKEAVPDCSWIGALSPWAVCSTPEKDDPTPRHYTLVGKPGDKALQICVKLLSGGVVSGGMHALKVGDVVGLAPPFGLFRLQPDKGAVLLSAGIGVTPMVSFLRAHRSAVKMAVHVDRSEASHAYREEFIQAGVQHSFHYTGALGRPTPAALVQEMKGFFADCVVYLCGPAAFMSNMKVALTDAGAYVVSEAFGPALAG